MQDGKKQDPSRVGSVSGEKRRDSDFFSEAVTDSGAIDIGWDSKLRQGWCPAWFAIPTSYGGTRSCLVREAQNFCVFVTVGLLKLKSCAKMVDEKHCTKTLLELVKLFLGVHLTFIFQHLFDYQAVIVVKGGRFWMGIFLG